MMLQGASDLLDKARRVIFEGISGPVVTELDPKQAPAGNSLDFSADRVSSCTL